MRRHDRAQALVEFVLVLPVLLVLLVGIFDVGRIVLTSGTLNEAVREGTRYAIVHGSLSPSPSGPAPLTDTAIVAVVQQYAVGVPGLAVTTSWPDGNADRGSRIVVTATSPFVPVLSAVFAGGGLSVTLRGGSTMVIEQ